MTNIIYYQDNYCKITNNQCQRGIIEECPHPKFGLEIPCMYFIHKEKENRNKL